MEPDLSVAMVSHDRVFADAVAASLSSRGGFRIVSFDDTGGGPAPDVLLVDSARGYGAAIDELYRLRPTAPEAKVIVLGVERETLPDDPDVILLHFTSGEFSAEVWTDAAGMSELAQAIIEARPKAERSPST